MTQKFNFASAACFASKTFKKDELELNQFNIP
jgi:hypothetical protein